MGNGAGIWSFIHIRDAARATVEAISQGDPGVYNVVDDEPAPVSTWPPALARAVGATPPFRVPVGLGRLLIGEGGVSWMTEICCTRLSLTRSAVRHPRRYSGREVQCWRGERRRNQVRWYLFGT